MKQIWNKKYRKTVIGSLVLLAVPVAAFYLMEGYTHNPFAEVRPWAQFFNIVLFELLAWIFVCLTGRIRSGLRIELVIADLWHCECVCSPFPHESDCAVGYFFVENSGECGF